MSKYLITHTNMSGTSTKKVVSGWTLFWHFPVPLLWEKVEVIQLEEPTNA